MEILLLKIPFFLLLMIALFVPQNDGKVESKNILVVSIFGSKSMKQFYEPLLHALANRGHKITALTPFKSLKPNANIRDIIGTDMTEDEEFKKNNMFKMRMEGALMNPLSMTPILEKSCREFYKKEEIQEILNTKFDLILSTYTFNECGFGLIHKLGVPFILMHANVPMPFNNPTGVPFPLSYIPFPFFGFSDKMSFGQRFVNFGFANLFGLVDSLYRVSKMERIYRDALGDDIPGASEIARNVSLIFANSHFSVNYPRPTMPTLVEVGGMHCTEPKPLPQVSKHFDMYLIYQNLQYYKI